MLRSGGKSSRQGASARGTTMRLCNTREQQRGSKKLNIEEIRPNRKKLETLRVVL